MGRIGFNVCTSFVGWDADHPDNVRFTDAYEDIYLSEKVLDLSEWHDGFVFDVVRRQTAVESKNLSPKAEGTVNIFDRVFPFGHHKKGNLK